MRYSPHFTDGKAESRESHPPTFSYYRAEIRFKPRPSWSWNVSSNLPPVPRLPALPTWCCPCCLTCQVPIFLNAFHLCIPSTDIQWIFVEHMNGPISYFVFPQGYALIMLPFDPTQEKGGRYCSEDLVSHSVWVKFSNSDEHLKAIPRCAKALRWGQKNGSFSLSVPFWCDFLFTAHSHLIVFRRWFINNVTFGPVPS